MNIKIKKIFTVVLAIVVVVTVVVSIIFYVRQEVMGNMSHNIKEIQTKSSDFSFTGSKGDRIKISLRTAVGNGSIDFVLSDSKGNVVEEFDRAKALETYVDLNDDDTYTLTAILEDFTGEFSAKISKRRW